MSRAIQASERYIKNMSNAANNQPKNLVKTAFKNSEAKKAIAAMFRDTLSITQLGELATRASRMVHDLEPPSASENKTRKTLYRWFEVHWADICPVLNQLDLVEEEE
jgi:hypothetical protein